MKFLPDDAPDVASTACERLAEIERYEEVIVLNFACEGEIQ